MKKLSLLLFLYILCAFSAAACDVSLFELISSETKNDLLASATSKLVSDAAALSEYIYVPQKGQIYLKALLEDWLYICTKFQTSPPEWALNDSRWSEKFNEISELLGKIRTASSKEQQNVHRMVMKFTRLISTLYEYMPMNKESRTRINITGAIDELWSAFDEKDLDKLKLSAQNLSKHCKIMLSFLPKELSNKGFVLYDRGFLVQSMAEEKDAFKSKRLEMLLTIIEYEFSDLNQEVLKLKNGAEAPQHLKK